MEAKIHLVRKKTKKQHQMKLELEPISQIENEALKVEPYRREIEIDRIPART